MKRTSRTPKRTSRNPVTARHLKHLEKMFRDHRAGKIDDARLQAEVWLAQDSGATRDQVQQIRERLNYYPRSGASRFASNPVARRTSRNPGIDTKLYSVIDRATGFERRHLTKEQAKLTLDAHEERCSRYGWRSEARVYYRDGTDVTREFRSGGMSRNPRLTESQRARLPLSVFVFPERRAFPLESEAAAYDAIRMLRLGRVKSASDFKAVTDAIRAKYPAVWKKYGAGLSWPKTKAAKALGSKRRAATVAKKKRTSRMAANPEAKLDKQDRAMINESLVRAGLDGNGRFRSVGMALSAASDVLDDYGLEPDEVLSAWKFSGPSGHTQIRVAESNRNDPFSPVPVENSVLAFSWHQLAEGRWEALAYMS